MEAAGLPALIPAAALPQVNAEDLSWAATIKQHRDLREKVVFYLIASSCLLTLSLVKEEFILHHVLSELKHALNHLKGNRWLTLRANCWAKTSLPALYVCVRPVSASLTITLRDRPANTCKKTSLRFISLSRGNVCPISNYKITNTLLINTLF